MNKDKRGPTTAGTRILSLLDQAGSCLTIGQASQQAGVCRAHAAATLEQLHSSRQVHVERWVLTGRMGRAEAAYARGDAADAMEPTKDDIRLMMALDLGCTVSASNSWHLARVSAATADARLKLLWEQGYCDPVRPEEAGAFTAYSRPVAAGPVLQRDGVHHTDFVPSSHPRPFKTPLGAFRVDSMALPSTTAAARSDQLDPHAYVPPTASRSRVPSKFADRDWRAHHVELIHALFARA